MRTCNADCATQQQILDLAGEAQGLAEPYPLYSLPPGASLARRLKALRSLLGLTQERLALEIGASTTSVVSWETGRCQPRKEMLRRLAQALHVPLAELTGQK
jgi:DNA-binding XRE family transcriptional regulator